MRCKYIQWSGESESGKVGGGKHYLCKSLNQPTNISVIWWKVESGNWKWKWKDRKGKHSLCKSLKQPMRCKYIQWSGGNWKWGWKYDPLESESGQMRRKHFLCPLQIQSKNILKIGQQQFLLSLKLVKMELVVKVNAKFYNPESKM